MSSLHHRVRVAVVIDAAPPWSKGGREQRLTELLERWVAMDLDVTVYSMRWWRESPVGPVAYRSLAPRMSLYAGERRSIVQAVVFALGTLQLLFRRYDVIQADHIPSLQLFTLRLVAWIRRVRLVVDWHEYWGTEYWVEYLGGRRGRVAAALERASLRIPDVLVPDSPLLARRLEAVGADPGRIVTVSNAVDMRRAALVVPDDEAPDMLFVGRLIAHKRADLVIEALGIISLRTPGRTLGIIGVGPERDDLARLASARGVSGQVRFYGSIPSHDEVWSMIRGARVVVAPSEREGFGIAVAESLAVGTPVVTVDDVANESRHLVMHGATGSVVAAGDASAVADAIGGWLDSPTSRENIARTFAATHPDLDWDVGAERYARLLRGDAVEPTGAGKTATD